MLLPLSPFFVAKRSPLSPLGKIRADASLFFLTALFLYTFPNFYFSFSSGADRRSPLSFSSSSLSKRDQTDPFTLLVKRGEPGLLYGIAFLMLPWDPWWQPPSLLTSEGPSTINEFPLVLRFFPPSHDLTHAVLGVFVLSYDQ